MHPVRKTLKDIAVYNYEGEICLTRGVIFFHKDICIPEYRLKFN